MIEYIKGELTELSPALATVEAAGVGYGLNISLTTYSAIQGKKDVKLYVFESIREDAHVLYGFVSKKEREMFELLITVNGVGPNTARMMLSSMSVSELCNAMWRRAPHQGHQRYRQDDGPAHHRRPEGQDRRAGHSRRDSCRRHCVGTREQRGKRRGRIGSDHVRFRPSTHAKSCRGYPERTTRPAR